MPMRSTHCEPSLDRADDKKKELTRVEGKLTDAKESIAQLTDHITELEEGNVALDKDVAEDTENRKEENSPISQQ